MELALDMMIDLLRHPGALNEFILPGGGLSPGLFEVICRHVEEKVGKTDKYEAEGGADSSAS